MCLAYLVLTLNLLALLLRCLELLGKLLDYEISLLIGEHCRGLVFELMTLRCKVFHDCVTTDVDLTCNLEELISGGTCHTSFD